MTPVEQAARYVAACPPAVSGQDGHGTAFGVVSAVVNGFALGEEDAIRVLEPWNATCQPPWSPSELRHKVQDAARVPHTKPRGGMIRAGGWSGYTPAPSPRSAATSPPPPVKYALDSGDLPEPVADGARALLRACFEVGEGVCIAPADLNDEGREVPDGGGIVMSREEWLKRLDAVNGDPNGIFSSNARTGIYIRCNPMKLGGSKDDDVTAFRHVLLEFDSISQEEQWNLYQQSRIPVAAIIDSGGKSVHAWVRVDARDRKEYDERVGQLYDHFAGYNPDRKNRNPSRFSRIPGCVRFDRRQELLQLGGGSESFLDWMKERQHDSLGKCLSIADLLELDTTKDPGCVIGFRDGQTTRYLCRGKAAWLIGPSGIGKSTLLAEFAIGWATGEPVFGIRPKGPLKSLVVQAENDDYDIAEMVQGIAKAHGAEFNPALLANVRFKTETQCLKQEFCSRLQRLIDREKPDIVWADPLLSFAGIDVSKQDQASEFLRQMLQPVLDASGVVLIGVHHTGKPKAAKDIANWTAIDHAYSGIGSSELVNWARAVMVLVPHGNSTFELKLAKRGGRAGARHPGGSIAWDAIWLEHGRGELRWNQTEPPAPPEPKPAKLTGPEWLASQNLHEVIAAIPEGGMTASELGDRLAEFARAKGRSKGCGVSNCRTTVVDLLVQNGKLAAAANKKFVKGKNA